MTEPIDLRPYQFIDFGCSSGGSSDLARKKLGGDRGLGLDIDPVKVALARKAGHDVLEVDATKLPAVKGRVQFSVMSHFLEHLPSFEAARKCINNAVSLSNRYVYIQQPWFDSDPYLFRNGLKLYWSDWSGHPNRMTTLEFHCILWQLLERSRIVRYCIYGRQAIETSGNRDVHPLESPVNSKDWTEGAHLSKKEIVFTEPVFREIVVILAVKDPAVIEKVESRVKRSQKLLDSAALRSPKTTAPTADTLPPQIG